MPEPSSDPRAVTEYRVPATALRPDDVVNTSPGDDDWQRVLTVHTREDPGADPELRALVEQIGDRYVVVRLTDVAPVDSPVYFDGDTALTYGTDGAPDGPVLDVLSDPDSTRIFLYTRYELVMVRS
jgi:hypothetical protein